MPACCLLAATTCSQRGTQDCHENLVAATCNQLRRTGEPVPLSCPPVSHGLSVCDIMILIYHTDQLSGPSFQQPICSIKQLPDRAKQWHNCQCILRYGGHKLWWGRRLDKSSICEHVPTECNLPYRIDTNTRI